LLLGFSFLFSGIIFSGCVQTSSSSNRSTFEGVLKDVFLEHKDGSGQGFYYLWLHFENNTDYIVMKWNYNDHVIPLYFIANENIGKRIRIVMEQNNCVWFEVLGDQK
jgi:hypothetical protein